MIYSNNSNTRLNEIAVVLVLFKHDTRNNNDDDHVGRYIHVYTHTYIHTNKTEIGGTRDAMKSTLPTHQRDTFSDYFNRS